GRQHNAQRPHSGTPRSTILRTHDLLSARSVPGYVTAARARKTYPVTLDTSSADIQVKIDVRMPVTPSPVVFLFLPLSFGPVAILLVVLLKVLTVSPRFPLVPLVVVFRFPIIVTFVALLAVAMFVVGSRGHWKKQSP